MGPPRTPNVPAWERGVGGTLLTGRSGPRTTGVGRVLGNEPAYDVKPHAPAVLDTAFEVIEYVLSGVCILPARAKNLSTLSNRDDGYQSIPGTSVTLSPG